MKSANFIGRRYELEEFEAQFERESASLTILYGRRRIGKTRLLEEFCKDKPAIRFEGLEKGGLQDQIGHFLKSLARQTGEQILARVRCESWHDALDLLTNKLAGGKWRVLIFDEFPWMVERDDKHVGVFKYYWDNHWSKTKNLMVFLCGSVNTFMAKKLVFSSALYGRVNKEARLGPFDASEVDAFFGKRRTPKEVVDIYMVFGGIPRYLEEIDSRQSVIQNINRLCFCRDGFFIREFDRLFKDEFETSAVYPKIVELLSKRSSLSITEIAGGLKRESGGGYKNYLENLELAGFVESYIPFNKDADTQLLRYRLTDEYLLFYFNFIKPNLKWIQTNEGENIFTNIIGKNRWNIWSGLAFERFCLKHAKTIQKILKIDQLVKNYGSFFSRRTTCKNGFQIDLLFERHDDVVTICEIKYSRKPIGPDIIPQVERKASLLNLRSGQTIENVLITASKPSNVLQQEHYFNRVILLDEFLKK